MRAMKDSGIPWIGEIPEGWEIDTIGNLYTLRTEKVSDKDYAPLSVTKMGIVPQLETAAKTDDGDNRKLVRVGDFAINSRSDRRGSCGISAYDGSVSLINLVLTPRGQMYPRFYNWLFHTELFADEFYKWGHGIVDDLWTTRWQEMKRISIISPSYQEQQRIAEFLDRKCAEVDEMVALQEKVIEELKAYKQSVITEAVTKGLNPAAPMRDSGIEWIGQIPEHWEVKRLKFVAERHNQKVSDEVLPYIGLENVESFSERFIETENEYDITQAQVCAVGDVIFGKLRPYLGKAMVIKTEHCCSSEFLVLSGSGAPSYLRYLMLSDWFVEIVNASTYGTKMPRANTDYIMNMQVVCSPIDERKAIADYLDEKCADIDSLIQTKQSKIDSLKEYKKSIIYEYVTGKREVE